MCLGVFSCFFSTTECYRSSIRLRSLDISISFRIVMIMRISYLLAFLWSIARAKFLEIEGKEGEECWIENLGKI